MVILWRTRLTVGFIKEGQEYMPQKHHHHLLQGQLAVSNAQHWQASKYIFLCPLLLHVVLGVYVREVWCGQ